MSSEFKYRLISDRWSSMAEHVYRDGGDRYIRESGAYILKADAQALGIEVVMDWNGEGLPPVGTVCEYQNSPGSWLSVEITAIAKKGICFVQTERDGENYVCQVSSKFRLIRTSEQIAAEEREDELNRMVATVSMLDKGWARKICARLYDTGYRKVIDGNQKA